MKITRMPNNSHAASPERVVIVRGESNGCLLAFVIFVCVVVALLLVFFLVPFMIANSSSRQDLESPGNSATAVTPDACASAQQSQPKPAGLYFFQESKDAMTDAAQYIFAWKSEKSREPFSLIDEAVVLRFSPTQVKRSTHNLKYEVECIIHADFSYVGRNKTTAAVRFDDKPARSWKCTPSTTGEGLFIDDARDFLSELAKARRCRVRFDDFGGRQHDIDFNLGVFSLDDFREKIVDCVLKSNQPNVKIVD